MNVLFHHPLPLNPSATSASGIRPVMMKEAFEKCGCEVDVVAGTSTERRAQAAAVKEKVRAGIIYDFVYSESSTMPTLLTDSHHLPLHPFLDFGLLSFVKKRGTKIGLFYRDIYWQFDDYDRSSGTLKAAFARFFYRVDLIQYEKLVDKLYLPSLKMGEYIPKIDKRKLAELPPGHAGAMPVTEATGVSNRNLIRLLYVGGIARHYRMHELFCAVKRNVGSQLTLCTREADWQTSLPDYRQYLSKNISVVHQSGRELDGLYAESDVALLFVAPQTYREFAVPFKLFEYLGYGKPVIASAGTLAGEFVARTGIGWTIPYSADAFNELTQRLLRNPEEIRMAQLRCREVAREHTWQARATQVITDMQALK